MYVGSKARALVSILAILTLPASAQERLGMITGTVGGVSLVRGGEESAARMMGLLHGGDRIVVQTGGTATVILFADGQRLKLLSASSVTIEGTGLVPESGPSPENLSPLPQEALRILRDQMQQEKPSRGAGVVFRGAGKQMVELELLSPVETRIANLRPEFRWKAGPGADRYRLTVSTLEGDELWNHFTEEAEIRYPESAPILEPGGFYFWDVQVFADGATPAVAGADFALLEQSELESLAESRRLLDKMAAEAEEDPTPRIALAALYRDLELFDDAETILRALGEQYPEEKLVAEALVDLFRIWGRELEDSGGTE